MSQPAITSHIKALEEDLGVRLFERTAGRVKLAPAGEKLRDYALEVNRLAQAALSQIGRLNGEQRGRLCLGASTTIAQYLLPRILAEFVQLHPLIEISAVSANTENIVAQVVNRTLHIGLIEGPPGTSELKVEPFIEDEIVVVVRSDHPFANSQQLNHCPSVADLVKEPLLMREAGSGTRRVVEDALRKAGIPLRDLRTRMELDSSEAIKSGIEAGLGLGFLSRWALRDEPRSIYIAQIRGLEINRLFQFIYPHGPDSEGPPGAFLRFTRQFRSRLKSSLAGP